METKTCKGKEIRIPGPDHPITISPVEDTVRVRVAGTVVAESMRALRLERLKDAWRLIPHGTPDAVGPSRWGTRCKM